MGFEHESIRRLGDRDWSERLLDALLDSGIAAAEREEIWVTLREVDDPRLAARLRAGLRDATLPPGIRDEVLQLISTSLARRTCPTPKLANCGTQATHCFAA